MTNENLNVSDPVRIGNDTLIGNGGSDLLDGGSGADVMIGGSGSGSGNETYVVDSLSDTAVELAGEGVDTVKSSLTWTLGSNLENLTLTPSTGSGQAENIDGTGNELDNVIIGNSAANTLAALAGNDTLDGSADESLVTNAQTQRVIDSRGCANGEWRAAA